MKNVSRFIEKKLELKGTETSPLYIKEGDRV